MSKKHLDEFFQEKFKGFEETPDEKVWHTIEASLDKRKKKRILPLWWQLGGVAAVLIMGLLVFNPFEDSIDPDTNGVTDIENTNSDSKSIEDSLNSSKDNTKVTNTENAVEIENRNETLQQNTMVEKDGKNSINSLENGIANSNQKKGSIHSNSTKTNMTVQADEKVSAQNAISKNTSDTKEGQDSGIAAIENNNVEETIPNNEEANSITNNENGIADSESINTDNKKEANKLEGKKSLYDEIKDIEKEGIVEAKSSVNRWSAGPSIAPVYFDALGKGSPVSPMFSGNSKSGNINLSYGLSVAYEISPKLSVRSGVHKVDYGYDTNDVFFTSSLSASSQNRIANIDYAGTAENLVVSANNATLNSGSKSFDVSARTANRSGVMAQQLGYLEVPVELSYALVNKKFGVHIIGGVSSLFLVENEVDLTSGNLTTQIGEANNVNDLNFSANFGLGLGYQFSPKLRLNIEPVFKYQLNTFSNVDGTFNPYTVGVYSGLSFKF
ncbi:outer membrane beta-barrel protein [Maribacter cobaltidurans]|uniref:Uncharacterized protein n=1 Tax=Maribacter cobaltidurans TaxID=1178778 RepID=A0A223V5M3_9FLAO|nr:outer membrane beta-barrel protein [Maribacter cobaltidurans]ASV30139.1 hypothetical protein CJ263_07825 [Maribacter cobaltidurans]GGD76094.1 hypothetical protein GCM10011412_12240 [Maribacter cobaltidurans]